MESTKHMVKTNDELERKQTEKKHFDIDFTCCTSVCSSYDYDW